MGFLSISKSLLSAFLKVKELYRGHQCPHGIHSLIIANNRVNVFSGYEMLVSGVSFLSIN